jgi:hypothetical protein
MDAFMGVTAAGFPLWLYRAGALLFFQAGDVGALLLEGGIPASTRGHGRLRHRPVFFLAEVRAKVGYVTFTPTLFYHRPGTSTRDRGGGAPWT